MTLTRDEARNRQDNLSVDTYVVELDLSQAKTDSVFTSTSTVRFSSQVDSTFIDITAEKVERLIINGTDSDIRIDDNKLELPHLRVGEVNTVTVVAQCRYSSTGEGLHRYRDPEDGRVYLYTQYEPFDAHRVYACFDQPDLKGRWSFTITAPSEWIVLSNQPETETRAEDEHNTRHIYAPTPPLSSYITCVVAGEYYRVDGGEWTGQCDGTDLRIPLALYCRQSLAEHLDADDIFTVTRQGFDFFHQHYGYAFPWGKYDQIYVPEYNLGAMENPGCVTFNEHMIVRGGASRPQRAGRTNTILHEMCHMWFGDLATPAWWDDLWLKESFADNQGTFAQSAVTEYDDGWTSFALLRKGWAYEQDQRPTTHPIMADIVDLDAAKQNFDGITYAKGAAVLKQLMVYVGEDAFFAAARNYFHDNAFSATHFSDLINALAEVSSVDLEQWVQSWLMTSGPSVIEVEVDEDGINLTQSVAQVEGATPNIVRPHRFSVACYDLRDNKLELRTTRNVILESEQARIEWDDEPIPDVVIPNADDATYAVFRLDSRSAEVLHSYISTIENPLVRAVAWQSLWLSVYDGQASASAFIDAVITGAQMELNPTILNAVLAYARTALKRFLAPQQAQQVAHRLRACATEQLAQAHSDDVWRMWALTRIACADAHMPDSEEKWLRECVEKRERLTPTQVWEAIIALAATGRITEDEIAELGKWDRSGEADVHRAKAVASLPDATRKAQVWDDVLHGDLSNEKLSAVLEGINRFEHGCITATYVAEFFAEVRRFWESHSIGMGTRFVRAAAPNRVSCEDGGRADARMNPTLRMADEWLETHRDAPHALRRLMVELRDDLCRDLIAQERFSA